MKLNRASDPLEASVPSEASVLVLEDSVLVAMAIEGELLDRGFDVVAAASIAAARESIANRTFTAALLDLHLPDGHAYDLALMLEAQGCLVALTSGADSAAVPEELAHLAHLPKPMPASRLADWVAAGCGAGQSSDQQG